MVVPLIFKSYSVYNLMIIFCIACKVLAAHNRIDMSPGSKEQYNQKRIACVNELKNEYRRIVGPFIKNHHAILVDTVDHGNLGDSFIQVGEVILLKEFGSPPKRACTVQDCNLTDVENEVKQFKSNAMICVHGGGNLGDFWRRMTVFKHKIINKFLNTPILFLPQSIFYRKEENAIMDSIIFSKHKNLTILVRDNDSLQIAKKYYKTNPTFISPDAAFMIGPIQRKCAIQYDILILSRGDEEQNKLLGDSSEASEILRMNNINHTRMDWYSWRKVLGKRNRSEDQLQWVDFHLDVAVDLFCRTRVVVTDRLHATILSTLMGLPHVFLDNQSRKINAYRETNFGPRETCKDEYVRGFSGKNWKEAAEMAMVLLEQAKSG